MTRFFIVMLSKAKHLLVPNLSNVHCGVATIRKSGGNAKKLIPVHNHNRKIKIEKANPEKNITKADLSVSLHLIIIQSLLRAEAGMR